MRINILNKSNFWRENSNFYYISGVSSSSSTSSSSVRNVTNLANLPPSERPKAKPSRKIVNNQQNNNAGGNSNNVVTDKSKKCQLQAALQQHSQQLAQLQQVKIQSILNFPAFFQLCLLFKRSELKTFFASLRSRKRRENSKINYDQKEKKIRFASLKSKQTRDVTRYARY